MTLHGFTMVPNVVLTKPKLSVGAKLAYAMVLKYAWHDNFCFPGQLKLAEDMGAGERSVRTYLKELETAGLLEIQQRGLGQDQFLSAFRPLWIRPFVAGADRQILPVKSGNDGRSGTAELAGLSIEEYALKNTNI